MNPDTAICQSCTAIKFQSQLFRCRGCESVWYCDKECQTRGWSEKGHKVECKILKVVRGIQVRDGDLIS
ncbi:hypothetical protein M430DRAFT_218734 [Amorphotheca resinae ATCC 22711]|uniref:MYND-type domain-containing protein n=1 Tax=Amorphotheca resinae ATCC 22711 TaxID=857342 RepID=A0A2T3B574_AMORE|nr:hypothetical protein M430DRAFT_218734 [Amorphotheca resinae ATCC 22711]PSS21914.1 hypothetical protein M430DRAFT_218734 [Amorphotheca resinae ATCC 22711]